MDGQPPFDARRWGGEACLATLLQHELLEEVETITTNFLTEGAVGWRSFRCCHQLVFPMAARSGVPVGAVNEGGFQPLTPKSLITIVILCNTFPRG